MFRRNSSARKTVRLVVGVLDPVVLAASPPDWPGRRDTRVLQTVHQPIPVVGRFHRNLLQTFLKRFERLQHGRQVAGQPLLKDTLAVHIDDRAKQVIAMQIDSSHTLRGHTVSFRFIVIVYSTTTFYRKETFLPTSPLMFISPHYLHFLPFAASWKRNSNCPSAIAPLSRPGYHRRLPQLARASSTVVLHRQALKPLLPDRLLRPAPSLPLRGASQTWLAGDHDSGRLTKRLNIARNGCSAWVCRAASKVTAEGLAGQTPAAPNRATRMHPPGRAVPPIWRANSLRPAALSLGIPFSPSNRSTRSQRGRWTGRFGDTRHSCGRRKILQRCGRRQQLARPGSDARSPNRAQIAAAALDHQRFVTAKKDARTTCAGC